MGLDGTLERVHHARYVEMREMRARGEPDDGDHRQPDRKGWGQRGAWLDPSGYDARKKVLGRKRHVLTDTLGLLLAINVHPASVQDRDGTRRCSARLDGASRSLTHHRRRGL